MSDRTQTTEAVSRRRFLAATTAGGAAALAWNAASETSRDLPLNVLLITVDDLRPELGCYGHPMVKTPNIDRLAREGVTFTRHYCQVALCSPSRTSLLTGLRPDSTGIYWIGKHFRDTVPDAVTLPQHFKAHGYHTQAFGKVYHDREHDDPASWTEPLYVPEAPAYGPDEMEAVRAEQKRLDRMKELGARVDPQTGLPLFLLMPGPSWEAPDVPDNHFWDGQVADRVIETLEEVKDRPFFLAAGIIRPHLPFVAPRKYFDLYPPEEIALPENTDRPENAPAIEFSQCNEWYRYRDIRKPGPLPPDKAGELIRGYYAATSYADAQVGRVLDALDRLGLAENTVVVLWGDNGYKLGEYGYWGKESNFELDTRVPLIVRAPGRSGTGATCDGLSESLDLYPTLCDLCGVPVPSHVEGTNLAHLLDDPTRPGKAAAVSQFFRDGLMGYTLRTERFRYTEWIPFDPQIVPARAPLPEGVGFELYDHAADPGETRNIASDPAHAERLTELGRQLRAVLRPEGGSVAEAQVPSGAPTTL